MSDMDDGDVPTYGEIHAAGKCKSGCPVKGCDNSYKHSHQYGKGCCPHPSCVETTKFPEYTCTFPDFYIDNEDKLPCFSCGKSDHDSPDCKEWKPQKGDRIRVRRHPINNQNWAGLYLYVTHVRVRVTTILPGVQLPPLLAASHKKTHKGGPAFRWDDVFLAAPRKKKNAKKLQNRR